MKAIADIEGIGPAYAEKLTEAGVKHVETLLEKVVTEAFHLGFQPDAIRAALEAALRRVRFDDTGSSTRKGAP